MAKNYEQSPAEIKKWADAKTVYDGKWTGGFWKFIGTIILEVILFLAFAAGGIYLACCRVVGYPGHWTENIQDPVTIALILGGGIVVLIGIYVVMKINRKHFMNNQGKKVQEWKGYEDGQFVVQTRVVTKAKANKNVVDAYEAKDGEIFYTEEYYNEYVANNDSMNKAAKKNAAAKCYKGTKKQSKTNCAEFFINADDEDCLTYFGMKYSEWLEAERVKYLNGGEAPQSDAYCVTLKVVDDDGTEEIIPRNQWNEVFGGSWKEFQFTGAPAAEEEEEAPKKGKKAKKSK